MITGMATIKNYNLYRDDGKKDEVFKPIYDGLISRPEDTANFVREIKTLFELGSKKVIVALFVPMT